MTSISHIILLLFLLLLASCRCDKEVTRQSAIQRETASGYISSADVNTAIRSIVNKDLAVTLKDVTIEYCQPGDSARPTKQLMRKNSWAGIREAYPAAVRAGEIILSDKSEELSNLRVSDISTSASCHDDKDASISSSDEKSHSKTLWPDYWVLIIGAICISTACVVALVFIYKKGKLKL